MVVCQAIDVNRFKEVLIVDDIQKPTLSEQTKLTHRGGS